MLEFRRVEDKKHSVLFEGVSRLYLPKALVPAKADVCRLKFVKDGRFKLVEDKSTKRFVRFYARDDEGNEFHLYVPKDVASSEQPTSLEVEFES